MKFVRPLVLLFALSLIVARAQSPDEQYIRIYQVIQEADRLSAAGQTRVAAGKYLEAQQALLKFQQSNRGWNERVINYRLNYVATKLAPLTASTATPDTNAVATGTNAAPPVATTPPPAKTPAPPAAETTPAPMVTTKPALEAPAPSPAPVPATPAPPPGPSPEVQQQLASLQAEVDRLRGENNRLGAKLKEALSVQPAAVDPRELARAEERIRGLEKENELMKVRLRVATNTVEAPAPAGGSVADLKARLAEQSEIVSALRAENEILKKRESAPRTTTPAQTALSDNQQVEAMRARIAALEAKPVPYTAEELALMSKPVTAPAGLAATTSKTPPPAEGAPRKASKELPPGAGPLVHAAERAFAAGNYPEAEKKYAEVLRQDENNISILANLAATQLEMGHIEEADKNVRKALAGDPSDYFSLYVLGRVRFRENKLDEALDAFSRAAQANPDDAESQNYLGIVLSEKGLRIPAEAALRRAVQLQPNHAAAHNNLAVVYATQTPPALALARWHYQRALAAGHAKNVDLEKLLSQQR